MSGGEVAITYTASSPAATSLHQIPPPPADFTGRERELAELWEALRSGGATISGLRGTGGIGKTALALKIAEELEPLYRDAQLYLDLKGMSSQPLTTAQAMAHVARAFHPTAQLPEGEDELAGLYRSVLHGRRALLLMDNAASRAQVEPLIPPAGCALLVTSRFRFTLPGIVTRDLDELLPEDAEVLLRRIAPRIGEIAVEIASLCGRLPLALRLAGSALAEKEWLAPADYARRLQDAKARLDFIDASLALSYDLLNEEQRTRWRQLAVFPGTFDAAGAAAVWGMEIDPARDALGELVNASLVEYESERYHLHDLARVFADSRLGEAEREAARCRHAVHYERVLRAANEIYLAGGGSLLAGLSVFDTEWENVKAGQAWAVAHVAEDPQAAELCANYPSGAPCLSLRLHPGEWIAWLEPALAILRRAGAREVEADRLSNLGQAYSHLGEPHRSIEHYERQLAIVRDIGYRDGESQALGGLGNGYLNLGEPQRAVLHYEQALTITRELANRRGEADLLGNLGLAYMELGEIGRAIEFLEQDLAIRREIGDLRGEGAALGSLGVAYARLGEPLHAIEYWERQLAIAREIRDRRGEGGALGNLGIAYATLGEVRRAIDQFEQVLTIMRESGDQEGEARTCWNLAEAYQQEGDFARAADLLQVCVDYERSIGHPDAEEDAARVAALRTRIG